MQYLISVLAATMVIFGDYVFAAVPPCTHALVLPIEPIKTTVRDFLAADEPYSASIPLAVDEVNFVHQPAVLYQVSGLFGGWDEADEALPISEVRKLLGSTKLLRLKHLKMQTRLTHHKEVARLLASSPNLSNLEVLTLRYSGLSGNDMAVIAGSPSLVKLTTLNLGGSQNGNLNFRISKGEYRPLFSNHIGAQGVRAIGNSPYLCNLIKLDISHNITSVGDSFLDGLADSPYLRKLRYLNIDDNYVFGREFIRFANSMTAQNLDEIRGTHGINLSVEEAEALMRSQLKPEIKMSLVFSANDWPANLLTRLHQHFPNVDLPQTAVFP